MMMTLVGRVVGMRDAVIDAEVEVDADAVDPLVSAYRHDGVRTAKNGLTRVGTHSKFGFGEFRLRPSGADRVPERAAAASDGGGV